MTSGCCAVMTDSQPSHQTRRGLTELADQRQSPQRAWQRCTEVPWERRALIRHELGDQAAPLIVKPVGGIESFHQPQKVPMILNRVGSGLPDSPEARVLQYAT